MSQLRLPGTFGVGRTSARLSISRSFAMADSIGINGIRRQNAEPPAYFGPVVAEQSHLVRQLACASAARGRKPCVASASVTCPAATRLRQAVGVARGGRSCGLTATGVTPFRQLTHVSHRAFPCRTAAIAAAVVAAAVGPDISTSPRPDLTGLITEPSWCPRQGSCQPRSFAASRPSFSVRGRQLDGRRARAFS